MNSTEEEWEMRYHSTLMVTKWFYLFTNVTTAIVGFGVLITVLLVYKRRDWFLITVPSCMFAYGALTIEVGIDSITMDGEISAPELPRNLIQLAIANFGFDMAHWFFSTQYLHTSLILPSLFAEAKVEWLQDEASPEHNNGEWRTQKI